MEHIMTIRVQDNHFTHIKYLTQSQFIRYMYTEEIVLLRPTDQEITTKYKEGELHITLNICQE